MNRKRPKRVKGGRNPNCFSLAVAFVTNAHIIRLRHSHSHALHSIMVERKGERVRCTTSYFFLACARFYGKQIASSCSPIARGSNSLLQMFTKIRVRIATSLHEVTSLYVLSTDLFLSSFVGNPKGFSFLFFLLIEV